MPLQFRDFARAAARIREFGRGNCLLGVPTDGAHALDLPADKPRPSTPTLRGSRYYFALQPSEVSAIRALGHQEGVTPFMITLAAFIALLQRYCDQDDLVVGTPASGRNRIEIEPLIGPFANTVMIRSNLAGNPTFSQLLTRTREATLGALDHQHLPFERLLERLQPEHDFARAPLFQVHFAVESAQPALPSLPSVQVIPLEIDPGTAKYDLALTLFDDGSGLTGRLEYSTDLFDRRTGEDLGNRFQELLRGLVSRPQSCLCDVALPTGTGSRQVVSAPSPRALIHDLIAAQARHAPHGTAVTVDNQPMQHGELEAISERPLTFNPLVRPTTCGLCGPCQ